MLPLKIGKRGCRRKLQDSDTAVLDERDDGGLLTLEAGAYTYTFCPCCKSPIAPDLVRHGRFGKGEEGSQTSMVCAAEAVACNKMSDSAV